MELDWQIDFKSIKERGLHLWQLEKWCDCKFLVGNSPSNQRLFTAHKLILAMSSPVFERMFYGSVSDESDTILIPDIQPDAFQAMLQYIYSDAICINLLDEAFQLCYVARKYMLNHLMQECLKIVKEKLSSTNACRVYEFAKFFDEPALMEDSMEIIADETEDVLNADSFLEIEVSTLMDILEQDSLRINSELDLFQALVTYAIGRGLITETNRNRITNAKTTTENDSENPIAQDNKHVIVANNNNADSNSDHPLGDAEKNGKEIHQDEGNITPTPSTSTADTSASTSFSSNSMETYEVAIRQAVKKIRFLSMTLEEFSQGPALSKLLKEHEALAILLNIVKPNRKDCPMPEGFHKSKRKCGFENSPQYHDRYSPQYFPVSPPYVQRPSHVVARSHQFNRFNNQRSNPYD